MTCFRSFCNCFSGSKNLSPELYPDPPPSPNRATVRTPLMSETRIPSSHPKKEQLYRYIQDHREVQLRFSDGQNETLSSATFRIIPVKHGEQHHRIRLIARNVLPGSGFKGTVDMLFHEDAPPSSGITLTLQLQKYERGGNLLYDGKPCVLTSSSYPTPHSEGYWTIDLGGVYPIFETPHTSTQTLKATRIDIMPNDKAFVEVNLN